MVFYGVQNQNEIVENNGYSDFQVHSLLTNNDYGNFNEFVEADNSSMTSNELNLELINKLLMKYTKITL